MKYLLIALALLGACEDEEVDKPAVKVVKAQCRDLLKHIVMLSPQTQGQDAEQIVAALPVEDIAGCVASEPEIRACMLTAVDIPAVRTCIPANAVLGCMQAAAKAKDAAHAKVDEAIENAKKTKSDPSQIKPVDDKPFDDIRAKCWAGDPNAANSLTTS